MLHFAIITLVVLNLATFIVYGIDKLKSKSKKGARRIPERILLILAAIGGSIGALLAMRTFRHKTQHAKFMYGVPAILILQVALAIYLLV